MQADFWLERWQKNEIGFHEGQPNTLLLRCFDRLGLDAGARVFVPLCGKSRDIGWLLANDIQVSGIELSKDAVVQLFEDLGITPEVDELEAVTRYRATNIDIFVGDVFALTPAVLGAVDAIYDRAALIALPEEMRQRYAKHIVALTSSAPQLLICLQYDQSLMEGPPFSVTEEKVIALYGSDYAIEQLVAEDVPGGLKGKCDALEVAWSLRDR
ncbi:MAG: thiopurine S-methyltransferase [Pseudomonadota bacterium]